MTQDAGGILLYWSFPPTTTPPPFRRKKKKSLNLKIQGRGMMDDQWQQKGHIILSCLFGQLVYFGTSVNVK